MAPKVTKVPDDYTVTLKYSAKPEQGKTCGEGADKKKEDKGDSAIGFFVVDRDRAMAEDSSEVELNELKKLLWPKYLTEKEARWRDSYNHNCLKPGCHTAPNNEPRFATGGLDQKITKAVACGHGKMHKIDNMESGELKGIISFIRHSPSGRYEIYEIIDANQELPLDSYCDKIFIQTQSILQTLTALSRLIDVPREHEKTKAEANSSDYKELARTLNLKIRYAKERPGDVFVAIKYCGFWFYIDDKEFDSKDVFSSTEGILSMSETGTKEGTPVLTLPVQ